MHDAVVGGIYEHYKGGGKRYRVLAIAKDHETWQPLVVYKALYGDGGTYVRPLVMFCEQVRTQAGWVPRFKHVAAAPGEGGGDFDEYQKQSRTTAVYPQLGKNVIFPTLGLLGEAGEVADKIKKLWRDKGGRTSEQDRTELAKEMGDVLWYLAQLATELKISLSEVAAINTAKIASRKERGVIHGQGDNR